MDKADYINRILAFGQTDEDYLRWHATRFLQTKTKVDQRLIHHQAKPKSPKVIFDVGAHWLHQSFLYAADGHSVIATDVGGVLAVSSVQQLAQQYGIQIAKSQGFDRPDVFAEIADASVDLVLFTEILEHITFNPVNLWQSIFRIMKPDGVVVITTPNYYFWQSRAWNLRRFLQRRGGGIPVTDIVEKITYGHHWKEYAAAEIVHYFELLPIPLHVCHAEYLSFNTEHRSHHKNWKTKLFHRLEKHIPIVRDSIYLEVKKAV